MAIIIQPDLEYQMSMDLLLQMIYPVLSRHVD